jgi:four helix bundle protein
MSQGFQDLNVYKLAYKVAMDIFHLSKVFPKEETYSLTDQIRRSSRSVCSNIAEGYRKRKYPKHFSSKMTDADGECSETMGWLSFAKDCGYITEKDFTRLLYQCEEIGKMLGSMSEHPEKFIPKTILN